VHFCLVKYFYDYEIDHAIVNAIFRSNHSLSQRKLKQIIESMDFLNRIIPEKTFRYHLKKLLNHKYISELKEGWKQGQKLPLVLTPITNEQIKLKTLLIEYKENSKDKENKNLRSYRKLKKKHQQIESRFAIELKRRMIYYLIFRVMSIKTPNRSYKDPGVSVTDIINARYDGHAFYYLRLEEDVSTVHECIKKLQDENIIRETKIDGEESRYILVERLWEDFVKDCSMILEHDIMLRLFIVWQNIRKPTPMERLHQEYCWGKRSADGRIKRVCKALEENREKRNLVRSNYDIKERAKHHINLLDYNLVQDVRELKKKYHSLMEKHTWICNQIINTVYPEFIREEVEKIVKNKKTRDKKFPKHQRIFSSDAIEFRDSAKVSQSTIIKK
jgi:hypothetical protein